MLGGGGVKVTASKDGSAPEHADNVQVFLFKGFMLLFFIYFKKYFFCTC